MRDKLIVMIKKWLDNHESAPSAHHMVHAIKHGHRPFVPEPNFYEFREGWNDEERDRKIDELDDDQLFELSLLLIEISDEKLNEID